MLIAVISAAATATFFQTVVIPVSDAGTRDELIELRKAKVSLEVSEKALNEEKRRSASLAKELAIAQHASLFTLGNPYPVGFRATPIGTPIATVKAQWSGEEVIDSDFIIKVKLSRGIFKGVSYYYDGTKEPKVSHVAYDISFSDKLLDPNDEPTLEAILTQTFGPATETKDRVGARWNIKHSGKSYWVYLRYIVPSIVVMDGQSQPKFW